MAFSDRTGVSDIFRIALGSGQDMKKLPEKMLCPSQHITNRYFIPLETKKMTIPVYICELCGIAYRYHELLEVERQRNP